MPTYDYECTHCGDNFELFQAITAKPIRKCPKCGMRPRRLIGKGTGIIFKGPGFYATDYRKPSSKEDVKKDSPKEQPVSCPAMKKGSCAGCKPPSN